MLTLEDYNHLKILYEQFRKSNAHIKDLISKDDWDSVDIAIQEKDTLLRKIIFFEKPRLNDIKENAELNSCRIELIELEKENLALVKELKETLSVELKSIKKAKKVINAYEPDASTISTVEFKDIDE